MRGGGRGMSQGSGDSLPFSVLRVKRLSGLPTVFARRILSHFGLRERLDGVYGSGLDGQLGTKPELVAHVLASEALTPQQAVMVGDTQNDVAVARNLGVPVIVVAYGYTRVPPAELGADRVIERFAELPEAIAALP